MRPRFGSASRGSSFYHFMVMGWGGVWPGTQHWCIMPVCRLTTL